MPHYESIRSGDPYRKSVAVTPSDADDLTNVARGLLATAAGDVVYIPVDNADAETDTLTVAEGDIIPCFVRRVLATGTTATVKALY